LLADWKKHGTLSGDSAIVSKTEIHRAWGLTHILLDMFREMSAKFHKLVMAYD
jgi:hypothetical protein